MLAGGVVNHREGKQRFFMSRQHILLMFDHRGCDVVVDIHLPLSEPIEEGPPYRPSVAEELLRKALLDPQVLSYWHKRTAR
jgi:hypothetical protein